MRQQVYEIIEGQHTDNPKAIAFDAVIIALILLNIAAFIAETVPSLQAAYHREFAIFEAFSVAVFTAEYLARLWVAVEVPFLSRLPAWKARARFAMRGPMIIDLLAILPFYLSLFLTIDLRILRVLRLLRFLKLSRYSPAMHTLIRVIANESRALAGAGLLLLAAVLFASTGIYFIESEAQPDKFGSVPEAAWWAVATLTTVGYGDVAPITALGKVFGAIVMVTGLCILALPVAIIATGFSQEVGRRDFVVNWSLMSRIPLFAELDAAEVAEIMPLLHAHTYPAGLEIIAAGSDGEAMYFIAAGRVRLATDTDERTYQQGDFFGGVAMLNADRNRASVRTLSRCRLLKIHREDFARLTAVHPGTASRIREIAEARLEAAEQQLAEA